MTDSSSLLCNCVSLVMNAVTKPFVLYQVCPILVCRTNCKIFPCVNVEKLDKICSVFQGNYVALNESEIDELNEEEYELKIAKSYETLANAGAHYVIDSIAELPPVIEDINRRLAAGERP